MERGEKQMVLSKLVKNWWALALRGVAAIIFGLLAIAWPSLTVLTLVLLFGAFALIDGILAIIVGIASHENNQRWWAMLFAGVAGLLIGAMTFFWPGATALVLLYFIAAWALVTGIFQIVAAIHLRRVIEGEWMVILQGVSLIIFGLILTISPRVGALSLVWLIGVFSICMGILLTVFAFRLRNLPKKN
jgi:uncharacterized membrane protein HdeD (DUF308 family)